MLKQEYKEEEMALKDALKLAVKVLDKTLDITKLTPDKGEHCEQPIHAFGCCPFVHLGTKLSQQVHPCSH